VVINIDKGIAFGTGIGITLVTGIADADAAGVSASDVVVNIYYK
jgi:mannitol/fructose-specific phosphotransferase system IIA component